MGEEGEGPTSEGRKGGKGVDRGWKGRGREFVPESR